MKVFTGIFYFAVGGVVLSLSLSIYSAVREQHHKDLSEQVTIPIPGGAQ